MSKSIRIILFAGLCAGFLTLPRNVDSQASSPSPNWHESVFFGIHYDLHANAQDTELGRELTPEHLRERFLRTRPDWVQTDCKGHPGYTSWPTSVGSTSPGVVKDSLRIYRDVTKELGIKLGVHYSGVWDMRAIELHPEWATVDAKGQRDTRATCRLHAYDEQLMIPQMMEIIDKYDVDGFWVDG
ncbi:MAG: alpha-L-fucosidase, partial [Terriglobia bacterium]